MSIQTGKLLTNSMLTLILSVTALFSEAHAQETLHSIEVGGQFTIQPAQTQSVKLDRPMYVQSLILQAYGVGVASTIEVMVNGQVKGTVYAPGEDPSFVVTVAEVARSIEFRHRAGGSFKVLQLIVSVSDWHSSDPGLGDSGTFIGNKNQVIELAQKTLVYVDQLRNFTSPSQEHYYLFPIKRNAGLVYVMATAHGDLAKNTIKQLISLKDQIDYSRSFLENLMGNDHAFNTVVGLLTIREEIAEMLD